MHFVAVVVQRDARLLLVDDEIPPAPDERIGRDAILLGAAIPSVVQLPPAHVHRIPRRVVDFNVLVVWRRRAVSVVIHPTRGGHDFAQVQGGGIGCLCERRRGRERRRPGGSRRARRRGRPCRRGRAGEGGGFGVRWRPGERRRARRRWRGNVGARGGGRGGGGEIGAARRGRIKERPHARAIRRAAVRCVGQRCVVRVRVGHRAVGPQQPHRVARVVQVDARRPAEEQEKTAGLNPRARGDDVRRGAGIPDVVQHPAAEVNRLIACAEEFYPLVQVVCNAIAVPVHGDRRGEILVEDDGRRLGEREGPQERIRQEHGDDRQPPRPAAHALTPMSIYPADRLPAGRRNPRSLSC